MAKYGRLARIFVFYECFSFDSIRFYLILFDSIRKYPKCAHIENTTHGLAQVKTTHGIP